MFTIFIPGEHRGTGRRRARVNEVEVSTFRLKKNGAGALKGEGQYSLASVRPLLAKEGTST